ncbi:MAG: CopG family transcriptional regulator [Desulfurococcales archaeon ex4484_204]|nr:MAG: CopG family transcriptional regulator [Desulfurococcales archaeon ex4484_204]
MVSRKTVGLDTELAKQLKEVASRRGVTLSNYLRMLIGEALELESRGFYAPKALREKRLEYILENLGFTLIPKELVGNLDSGRAEEMGERVGAIARELGVEAMELIELLCRFVGNTIFNPDKIVIVRNPNDASSIIGDLIKGIAVSAGLNTVSDSAVVVIELPREKVAEGLREFSERKRRRKRR